MVRRFKTPRAKSCWRATAMSGQRRERQPPARPQVFPDDFDMSERMDPQTAPAQNQESWENLPCIAYHSLYHGLLKMFLFGGVPLCQPNSGSASSRKLVLQHCSPGAMSGDSLRLNHIHLLLHPSHCHYAYTNRIKSRQPLTIVDGRVQQDYFVGLCLQESARGHSLWSNIQGN